MNQKFPRLRADIAVMSSPIAEKPGLLIRPRRVRKYKRTQDQHAGTFRNRRIYA
jgi:hypothetical protein